MGAGGWRRRRTGSAEAGGARRGNPLLDAGGHIVKRMGDGIMAVFRDPTVAVRAVVAAKEELKSVDVDGYTPRMRVGIHTGRRSGWVRTGWESMSTLRLGLWNGPAKAAS